MVTVKIYLLYYNPASNILVAIALLLIICLFIYLVIHLFNFLFIYLVSYSFIYLFVYFIAIQLKAASFSRFRTKFLSLKL